MPETPSQPGETGLREDLTGTNVGRFAVRTRLGSGGMGEVYRADDTALKRSVALKRLAPRLRADQHYRERFLKEAERASSLSHQNIAGIYDVFEHGGEPFLVMEFVEGTTLRERLKAPIAQDFFLKVALQCAEALTAAHEKRLVHRDIKPENIMLARAGGVKILDFGVARRLPHTDPMAATDSSAEEIEHGLTGTISYMAPEVLQNLEADGRADIFSLGIVFYEMLAGRHPFLTPHLITTTDRILHEVPVPPSKVNPGVPPELDEIIERMLAKDPAGRYADATDLLADLRSFAAEGKLKIPRRAPSWRWKWTITGAAVLVFLLFLFGVLIYRKMPKVPEGGRAGIPALKGVVVLPFRAIGGGPEEQIYCDGVTETLTAKLTQLTATNELTVVPASEVRERHVTTPDSARKDLGANLVLSGTLYRAGGRVRINYELVDARTLRQLRADTLTAKASDPFAVQDKVAKGAVEMLDLALKPAERQAMVMHGTHVASAYDLFLEGRGYLQNYDKPENIESAIAVFQHALKLDSNYALAYAGLGESFWYKYENTKGRQWVNLAREDCERAASLDSKAAEPQLCLGTLDNGTGKYERAVEEFSQARSDEPTLDAAYRGLASAFENLHKDTEAEKTFQSAIQLRPRYWGGYNALGAFYFRKARYAQAAAMFEKVVELAPDSVRGYSNLGGVYILQGRYSDAIPIFKRAVAIRPMDDAYSNLGTAYFYLRRFDESATSYQQALNVDPQSYIIWGNLGDAYYWLQGKKNQAEDDYRKASLLALAEIKVNPRDARVLGYYTYYQAMRGRRNSALDSLREALKIAPADAELRFNAALTYNQLGQSRLAADELKQALADGYSLPLVRDTPILDSMHSQPIWQELTRQK